MVFATFALMVGFSVLMLSNFIPLVYFGVLVSAAMLGGLIGNLTFFPLLLRWADRDEVTEPHEVVRPARRARAVGIGGDVELGTALRASHRKKSVDHRCSVLSRSSPVA